MRWSDLVSGKYRTEARPDKLGDFTDIEEVEIHEPPQNIVFSLIKATFWPTFTCPRRIWCFYHIHPSTIDPINVYRSTIYIISNGIPDPF